METLAQYLLKSAVWLSGFTLIFFLFLRNERYFSLKRLYLVTGMLASLLLPFLSIHYYIEGPSETEIFSAAPVAAGLQASTGDSIIGWPFILVALYTLGTIIVTLRIIFQGRIIVRSIKTSEVIPHTPVKLVRTDSYASPFSFFSYVFVNPSVSDVETREIMNHEMVHIRQKHWADLLLAEFLCIVQWFNPLAWLYVHFMRQNHEYLADEGALQSTSDPSVYRAALLNQIAGATIFSLSNSFGYSLTKKRFNMMKNIKWSPYRKLKLLLILPVVAVILYAFAQPVYRTSIQDNSSSGNQFSNDGLNQGPVKGAVVSADGKPLEGAAVVIRATTIGTITDSKGLFALTGVPEDASLVVTFVGFKSKVVKPLFNTQMKIEMVMDTIRYGSVPPPPPPPPPASGAVKALVVVDGKIYNGSVNEIGVEKIESITVLKGESATKLYGDKGKDGVIEITLKKGSAGDVKKGAEVTVTGYGSDKVAIRESYAIVEELPQFPGGHEELVKWIIANFKYPPEAVKNKITGKVLVDFLVDKTGKISNVKVSQSVHPLLDAEAVRLISSMPSWIPGKQAGKPVDVYMKLPVDFKLN
jgi:TonB family protein